MNRSIYVFNRAVSNLTDVTSDAEDRGEAIVGAPSECDAVCGNCVMPRRLIGLRSIE